MGLIIDINTLPCVFSKDNVEHELFVPVLKWVIEGKSKIIIGGTKYIQELQKCFYYYKLIIELKRIGKVVTIESSIVDGEETRVLSIHPACYDFDDSHVLALIISSNCCVLCSNDYRSFKYIQDKKFYPKGRTRPKIYTSLKRAPAKSILKDENLSPCCFPVKILSKEEISKLAFYKCD